MPERFEIERQPQPELPTGVEAWARGKMETSGVVNEYGRGKAPNSLEMYVDLDTDITDKDEYPDEVDGMNIVYIHAERPELLSEA